MGGTKIEMTSLDQSTMKDISNVNKTQEHGATLQQLDQMVRDSVDNPLDRVKKQPVNEYSNFVDGPLKKLIQNTPSEINVIDHKVSSRNSNISLP